MSIWQNACKNQVVYVADQLLTTAACLFLSCHLHTTVMIPSMRKLIIKAEAPPKKKAKGPAGAPEAPPPKITHGQIYVADRFVGWQEAVLRALQVRLVYGWLWKRGESAQSGWYRKATARQVVDACTCCARMPCAQTQEGTYHASPAVYSSTFNKATKTAAELLRAILTYMNTLPSAAQADQV